MCFLFIIIYLELDTPHLYEITYEVLMIERLNQMTTQKKCFKNIFNVVC